MRNIAVIAAAFLLASPVQAAQEPYAHDELAIVKVSCKEGSGSATRVGRNEYISVSHVTSMTNCIVGGLPIIITHDNPDQDFSTFLGAAGASVISVSCKGFKSGTAYVSRGFAGGGDEPWYEPVIAVAKYKGLWAFAGHHFPGMSGGPILDSKGRITGTINIMNPTGGVDLSETPVCKGD